MSCSALTHGTLVGALVLLLVATVGWAQTRSAGSDDATRQTTKRHADVGATDTLGDAGLDASGDSGTDTEPVGKRVAELRRRAASYRKSGLHSAAKAVERHADKLERRAIGRKPDQNALTHATKLLRIEALLARYGERLRDPAVIAELALHGRRTAKLIRMKSLVAARPDGAERKKLLERIDRALGAENARYQRTMAKLTTQ